MLFSIVTVTKDNLPGLRKTYHSLAEQSLQAFEWLVIDGASKDDTSAFLDEAQADYTSEPDHGIYDAMNKGIARARGFFILFLNAGDCLAGPRTLEDLAAYIEQLHSTPQFIYGDALEQRPGQSPAYKPARPYKNAAFGMFTHHQAMLYRTDLIGELRYDLLYDIAADYKFTLQYLAAVQTVVYYPAPICLFEQGGISQRKASRGRREQFVIRAELGTVPPLKNRLIRLMQSLVWAARQIAPALYWTLKSGNRKTPRNGGASS